MGSFGLMLESPDFVVVSVDLPLVDSRIEHCWLEQAEHYPILKCDGKYDVMYFAFQLFLNYEYFSARFWLKVLLSICSILFSRRAMSKLYCFMF